MLFVFEGADDDKCSFNKDRSSILIFLDYGSVLVPSDSVMLLPAKLTSTSISQSVYVLPPLLTKYPKVNVVARKQIGAYRYLSIYLSMCVCVNVCKYL